MRQLFLLLAALALVVTACRAEVNLSIEVAESGETVVSVEIGADEEFQNLLGAGGGDPSSCSATVSTWRTESPTRGPKAT